MKYYTLLFSLILLILLSLPAQSQEPQVNAQRGKAVYKAHCMGCHGLLGKGDGPDAANLIVPPTNFHSPKSRIKSERDLRSTIIWGLAFSPMHSWWDILSLDEIRSVTAYIRQLAPYQPSTP